MQCPCCTLPVLPQTHFYFSPKHFLFPSHFHLLLRTILCGFLPSALDTMGVNTPPPQVPTGEPRLAPCPWGGLPTLG